MPQDMFRDQYVFKPTGSIALIYFMHQVTRLLEEKNVRCLLTDFSKAFDKVDHTILVQKLTSSSAMAERPRELDQRFQMGGSI